MASSNVSGSAVVDAAVAEITDNKNNTVAASNRDTCWVRFVFMVKKPASVEMQLQRNYYKRCTGCHYLQEHTIRVELHSSGLRISEWNLDVSWLGRGRGLCGCRLLLNGRKLFESKADRKASDSQQALIPESGVWLPLEP